MWDGELAVRDLEILHRFHEPTARDVELTHRVQVPEVRSLELAHRVQPDVRALEIALRVASDAPARPGVLSDQTKGPTDSDAPGGSRGNKDQR